MKHHKPYMYCSQFFNCKIIRIQELGVEHENMRERIIFTLDPRDFQQVMRKVHARAKVDGSNYSDVLRKASFEYFGVEPVGDYSKIRHYLKVDV